MHHHFQSPFGMVAEYAHPAETLSKYLEPVMPDYSVTSEILGVMFSFAPWENALTRESHL